MTDPPRLTVAVPTYNGARHLAETLRSILDQDEVDFRLIVCDDQSTDATPEIVHDIAGPSARFERNPDRLGLAGNWNRCVALAETPYVAIIHQDDLLRPGHLAAHLNVFEDDPVVGLVASGSEVIDDEGRPVPETVVDRGGLGAVDRRFSAPEATAALASGNPLRCSAVSIRKAAHEAVGGFDPSYRYVVDWDFWLRVAADWSLCWLARPTVDVRWHPRSETHTFKTGTLDLEETEPILARLAGANPGGSPGPRLARAYLNRAHDALRAGDGALARRCLGRAIRLDRSVWRTVLADPRLAAQMTATAVAPGLAARLFRKGR